MPATRDFQLCFLKPLAQQSLVRFASPLPRRTNAEQALAFEYDPPSALSHFEPADLLDALSIGVVVLDAQLCIIYANAAAQDALALRVDQARGRPIAEVLAQSNDLIMTLRRALENGEYSADCVHSVRPLAPSCNAGVLDMTIKRLASQVTGTHLLLELAGATARRSTSHEKESIALTNTRLAIR